MNRILDMNRGFSSLCLIVILCMPYVTKSEVEHYVIDTLVVMDSQAFSSWIGRESMTLEFLERKKLATVKVKEYISLVIRQANERLQSLTDNINNWTVRMSVAGFDIDVNPLGLLVIDAIPVQEAINSLKIWVSSKGYASKYDYVILMTGYNLFGDASNPYDVKGVANVGALCTDDGTSVAIVEDRGGFQSVHFVAHEIGHSLGSPHDGVAPNAACPDADRYLMAIYDSQVTSSNRVNPWYFSSCSKRTIGNYLVKTMLKDHSSCLKNSLPPAPEFTATDGVLGGQIYNSNTQCQHIYGPESRLCLGGNFGDFSDICTAMFCLVTSSTNSGSLKCAKNRAAEGTSCGDGKICQLGRCTLSSLAPKNTNFAAMGNCIFGDSPVIIENAYTCAEYIPLRPKVCYQSNIYSVCCTSCDKQKQSAEACPYGNKVDGCYADLCQRINVDGTRYEEQCCKTCGYDVTTPCSDVAIVDGMTCDDRVKHNGFQACYDTKVAYQCCKTCERLRTNVSGCEYGDRRTNSFCQREAYSKISCAQVEDDCCHTCENLTIPDKAGIRLEVCLSHLVASVVFVYLHMMCWRM